MTAEGTVVAERLDLILTLTVGVVVGCAALGPTRTYLLRDPRERGQQRD